MVLDFVVVSSTASYFLSVPTLLKVDCRNVPGVNVRVSVFNHVRFLTLKILIEIYRVWGIKIFTCLVNTVGYSKAPLPIS